MSVKGRRNRAWEDEHLRGPLLWPVKAFLRAFSSITLAVTLLVLVCLYGVSASVPVGLMVYGLTYAIYGLTILAAAALVAGLPVLGYLSLTRGKGRGVRFAGSFILGLALVPIGVALWHRLLWPALHYDPATGEGLKLFASFVEQYRTVTIRRLPGMEMTELEFYSWWPLQVVLLLFVLNLVVATVRRIEFTFKNLGVLTVHTGIVVMALGSIYYAGLKKEGDTLLLAGELRPEEGHPGVGPLQDIFYDNTKVALLVTQDRGWEQMLIARTPRYNNYNLGAFEGESAWDAGRMRRPWATTDQIELLDRPFLQSRGGFDQDLRLRVVGYAHYAEGVTDWARRDFGARRIVREGDKPNPLRIVFLHSAVPDDAGNVDKDTPAFAYTFLPQIPARRTSISRDPSGAPVLSVEYTLGAGAGMPPQRWQDLAEPLPQGTMHALVIEVPGTRGRPNTRLVTPVAAGDALLVGDTGFRVRVKEVLPEPPFPIITRGYEDATSSVVVLDITTPEGQTYERYVYHRFPELNQDILGTQEDGRPNRRDADGAIRVALIESDHLSVYMDEDASGATRAIVREVGGAVRVMEGDAQGWLRDVVEKVSLRVGVRWEHAEEVTRPAPVAEREQDRQDIGTHNKALLGVEVTITNPALQGWRRVVWLPFSRYMGAGLTQGTDVELPDGRMLTMVFGRLQHRFETFAVRLVDFEMISYDHRGAPRDYQSIVDVIPAGNAGFDAYRHVTKLNAPLRAPFMENDERSLVANVFGRLASALSPYQFKLSQAGWDQQGWRETQTQADAGLIPGPFAKFTILGVGNNPGIHVIALGGILMGMGVPWAFYVKPWLVRREKQRIQQALRDGTYVPPRAPATAQTARATAEKVGTA